MTPLYIAAVAVFEQAIRDWPEPERAIVQGKVSADLLDALFALGNVLGTLGYNLDQRVTERTVRKGAAIVSLESEAQHLLDAVQRGREHPVDFQRFIGELTGDPLIGGRYTREQMLGMAQRVVAGSRPVEHPDGSVTLA